MVVVSHHAVGVQCPTGEFAGLEQALLERYLCSVVIKDPRAVITTVDDVVDCTWIFKSGRPGHEGKVGGKIMMSISTV